MQPPPENNPPEPLLLLVERLDACWERYRSELKRTRRDFANEYVHDLRVSIRRLIAAVEMGRAVVRMRQLKRLRRLLKAQLDAFDELRDTQVQLTIVEELQEDLPEIAPYRDYLRKHERRLISRLAKKVKQFSPAGLARQVARLRTALLDKDLPEADTAIWSAIDEAYAVVLHRKAAVRAEDTLTIHRLRLAFKQFRYMVESTYRLLPNPPENYLRLLHLYQTSMGEIQDAEVGLQMLSDYTGRSGRALTGVQTRLAEMHRARVRSFVESMDEVEGFWRAAASKKYPWQSTKRSTSRKTRESS